jgi:hypothetical protein
VLPTLRRYFRIDYERALGGGIAYLVLTHNAAFLDAASDRAAPWVDMVLERDAALTDACPSQTLFAYIVAVPDRAALTDSGALARWTADEDEREAAALADGGRYYTPTSVALAIEHERIRTRPPAEACRAAMVSFVRAVARHAPAGLQDRVRNASAVQAVWQRLSRVYRD